MVLMLEEASPTAIIASANPINGEWSDPEKIDLDEIPAMKPLIDRFDLIFVTRNIRNEQVLRDYASKKLDLYARKVIPDYILYLQKYIEYSKRFNPVLSKEAEHMLKEYYVGVALRCCFALDETTVTHRYFQLTLQLCIKTC